MGDGKGVLILHNLPLHAKLWTIKVVTVAKRQVVSGFFAIYPQVRMIHPRNCPCRFAQVFKYRIKKVS